MLLLLLFEVTNHCIITILLLQKTQFLKSYKTKKQLKRTASVKLG